MVTNLPANAEDTRDTGSIPGSGRSPGVGNGNLLQYSCLENSMDRGALWATVHEVAKSQTQLSDFTFTFFLNVVCILFFLICCFFILLYFTLNNTVLVLP